MNMTSTPAKATEIEIQELELREIAVNGIVKHLKELGLLGDTVQPTVDIFEAQLKIVEDVLAKYREK